MNAFDRVMAWFFAHRRDLPWRRDRSIYAVLVSEMMLQQTQVSRVVGYYERFMRRFPTLLDLASAPLDEVYRVWSGLGYYRRARYLWETARRMVQEGTIPEDRWEDLPGLGRYTASALRAFALNEPVGVVDANVGRVIARFRGIVSKNRRRLQEVMDTLVRYGKRRGYEPRDVNEAFMELGALVCGRQRRCFLCPLREVCCTYLEGEDRFVVRQPRAYVRVEERCVALVSGGSRVWMVQGGRWREGLWDLPLLEEVGYEGERLGGFSFSYGVTRHRVEREVEVYEVSQTPIGKGRWVSMDQPEVGLGSPAHRCLQWLRAFVARDQSER